MLHFALTQIVKALRPSPVLREILHHMPRKKDVTSIAAIHYPLRQVDARAGDIGAPVQIGHFAYRAAMNSHSHLNLRVFL